MSRALVLAALLFTPCAVRAQSPDVPAHAADATVDAGATHVRFGGGPGATAFSLTPAVRWSAAAIALRAAASGSAFSSGGWSLQGLGGASLYTPVRLLPRAAALRGELAASLGGTTQGDGTRTGQMLAVARAHVARGAAGAWLGAGGGRAADSAGARATTLAEVGAWRAWDDGEMVATLTPTRTAGGVQYTDAVLAGAWSRGPLALDAQVGARVAHRVAASVAWGGLGAAWALGPRLALVAGAGSYPADPTQSFPGGRYATAAVRAAVGPRRPSRVEAPASAAPTPVPIAPAGPVRAFESARAADGRQLVRVHAPGARTVELMGDVTDWSPLRLARADGGWWEARLDVAPGVHELNVRADGGPWLVPPGLRARADEAGGAVGMWLVR